jgi:transcriptional regulator with PAS, ATPase and Fis domain
VKLLRVLESRKFYRLGELNEREFRGKIIAATNRDLDTEIREGRFRRDFYYRLCGDLISTPSLREQLDDQPDDLHNLAYFLAHRLDPEKAESLAGQVVDLVEKELGPDHQWPGNMRELTQYVRNIMIHKRFVPLSVSNDPTTRDGETGINYEPGPEQPMNLTAKELLSWYCTLVYSVTGSFEAAARWLEIDPRTVRKNVDLALLEKRGG